MCKKGKYLWLALIVLFSFDMTYAQSSKKTTASKAALEKNKQKIEEEISYTNRLLNETAKNKEVTVQQIVVLQNQIQKREQLIGNIQTEIHYVADNIVALENDIVSLQEEIADLKEEYAKIIVATNRNKNTYDRLVYILASQDLNQAYRRVKYFQQYSANRTNQVRLIEDKQNELKGKKQHLVTQKQQKTVLLSNEQKQKAALSNQEKQKNQAVEELRKKEKKLKEQIAKKKKDVQKLNDQIQKIINEEIRKAAEEARKREAAAKSGSTASSTKTAAKTTTFELTPEEKKLSDNFANNKGKLPWPTERGVISGSFGEHEHPVLKGVMVMNHGIDILTTAKATVRTVFSGTVTRVFSTPKGTKAIIIRHGDYLTVYSNLENVSVKENQKVTTKQEIGTIYTDEDNRTELQFQIWKGNVKMNPAVWIKQ